MARAEEWRFSSAEAEASRLSSAEAEESRLSAELSQALRDLSDVQRKLLEARESMTRPEPSAVAGATVPRTMVIQTWLTACEPSATAEHARELAARTVRGAHPYLHVGHAGMLWV